MSPLIRELAEYALAKRGAERSLTMSRIEEPEINLAQSSDLSFFRVRHAGDEAFAYFLIRSETLLLHQSRIPSIIKTDWLERKGLAQIKLPLSAGVPIETVKAMIDDSYNCEWANLTANALRLIELTEKTYDEQSLLDQLIDDYDLGRERGAIRSLARRAILLRTKPAAEDAIPIGSSKIGGRPDLPEATKWPTYRDGRPLAFLAQVDLAEVAQIATPIPGLPTAGLISLFSVYGWESDAPDDRTHINQEEFGWTIVVHNSLRSNLRRRETPRKLHAYPAAPVDLIPILSLPNGDGEPCVTCLNWSPEVYERFDDMQSTFRRVQMKHWLGCSDTFTSHHLLGGYALFQQQFPVEVLEKRLAMFMQIGTDDNTLMCWGDGGELTIYMDASALAAGRFERIWATCQGG